MRAFLKRSIAFLAFLIVFFYVVFAGLRATQQSLLRLPEGRHILFLGNSHTEHAINDSIVTGAFNFGRSAERIEFLYTKLKMMKRVNPQIDTVFIGLDYILMCHRPDEAYSSVLNHPYNYMEYNIEDWGELLRSTNFDYKTSMVSHPLSWMKMVDLLHLCRSLVDVRDCRFLGGYLWSTRDELADDPRNEYTVAADDSFARIPFNYYFVGKCIDYCRQHNIVLRFFCPPQHRYCSFAGLQKQLVDDFKDIPFYNCVRMDLPDSCFADLDHLNHKGASIYSQYFEHHILHPSR